MKKNLILVRGGGDIATGTIYKLHQSGYAVLVLEIEYPSAIRRYVAFSEAVYEGTYTIEGVTCKKVDTLEEAYEVIAQGMIPLMVDANGEVIREAKPAAVVDAILAKKNLGTNLAMAPFTVALGPGFTAGYDVNVVVETMRGHKLGRIIQEGTAIPNTGVPGAIAGVTKERVIHSEAEGYLYGTKKIADYVKKGEIIAYIYKEKQPDGTIVESAEDTKQNVTEQKIPVYASISGILRGLIRDGYPVTKGFKIADIDPRESEYENCFTISDKARCIAGGVLEALLSAGILPERQENCNDLF